VELVFGFNPLAVNANLGGTSAIRKSAKLHRFSGIFFQKFGSWPLGCVGSVCLALLPDAVGQRVVKAVFPPHRISGRKLQKNRARKAPHLAWA
jgi:hypothetical protein